MVATGPPIRPLRGNRNAAVTASAATAAFRFQCFDFSRRPVVNGSACPVSSSVLRLDSTTGHPPRIPRSISEPGTSPSCVTVGFTTPSCGSTTRVTRDSPLSPDGVRHVTTSRRWRIVPDLY